MEIGYTVAIALILSGVIALLTGMGAVDAEDARKTSWRYIFGLVFVAIGVVFAVKPVLVPQIASFFSLRY